MWTSCEMSKKVFYFVNSNNKMPVAFAEIMNHLSEDNELLNYNNVPYTGIISKNLVGAVSENQYLNGRKHGIQKLYFPCGQLKEATMYTNGLANGRFISYYEDGSKRMNASYSFGEFDGLLEVWSQCGRLLERKTYYHGKLVACRA